MRTATIYLDRGHRGRRYRVTAGNGEIIAHSESYTRRSSAIRAVKGNVADLTTIRILNRKGGEVRTIVP